jgi:hypothetical protein
MVVCSNPSPPSPTVSPSPGALAHAVATAVKHLLGSAGNTLVGAAVHSRASLAVVGGRLLSPLASTDVSGIETLRVHLAGVLSADGEALLGAEEAAATTVTEHTGALTALGGLLAPTGPGDALASTMTARISHWL